MPGGRLWRIVLAMLGVLLAGCSLTAALQEAQVVQKKLQDGGYENVSVNVNANTQNKTTTRTIAAKVQRPAGGVPDERAATQVANLVIESYPKIDEIDRISVELTGSGASRTFENDPPTWRDKARELNEPPGIASAVMARDARAETFEPVDVTTAFPADQAVFHAVVRVRNLPAGAPVRAVWTAVETHGATQPNFVITSTDATAEGTRNLDFTIRPNAGKLPKGSYKVDIYLGEKLDKTLPFTVDGG